MDYHKYALALVKNERKYNMKNKNKCTRIGEIYQIKFTGHGNVQRGWRPGIIIQNDMGNKYSPNVIALPLTSVIKKEDLPTHVYLPSDIGLKLDSMVLCENPETISKEDIGDFITNVPASYMVRIAEAFMCSIPIISYLNEHEITKVWLKTSELVL